jgi:hypothetical protein
VVGATAHRKEALAALRRRMSGVGGSESCSSVQRCLGTCVWRRGGREMGLTTVGRGAKHRESGDNGLTRERRRPRRAWTSGKAHPLIGVHTGGQKRRGCGKRGTLSGQGGWDRFGSHAVGRWHCVCLPLVRAGHRDRWPMAQCGNARQVAAGRMGEDRSA